MLALACALYGNVCSTVGNFCIDFTKQREHFINLINFRFTLLNVVLSCLQLPTSAGFKVISQWHLRP